MPPLYAMPDKLVRELPVQLKNEELILQWKQSLSLFRKSIETQQITLILLDPECVILTQDVFFSPASELIFGENFAYTKEQYLLHIDHLKQMEKQYENLKVCFVNEIADNTLLYIKENTGIFMAKTNAPKIAFVINEQTMVSAFWDYMERRVL